MKKLIYGEGKIHTQRGLIGDNKCLTITEVNEARPIGSQVKDSLKSKPADEHDVILVFLNIESARTLQDELNDLISDWSKEKCGLV